MIHDETIYFYEINFIKINKDKILTSKKFSRLLFFKIIKKSCYLTCLKNYIRNYKAIKIMYIFLNPLKNIIYKPVL